MANKRWRLAREVRHRAGNQPWGSRKLAADRIKTLCFFEQKITKNAKVRIISSAAIRMPGLQPAVDMGVPTGQIGTFYLKRREVTRLEKNSYAKGIKLWTGMLWVTGTPASGDMVLFPCESFIFRDEWPYLIEAL